MVLVGDDYEDLVGNEGSSLLWADRIDYSHLTKETVDDYVKKGVPLVVANCTKGKEKRTRERERERERSYGKLHQDEGMGRGNN